jgi:Arc/MetJ-type ribon-helix-helix transcriptional regulator
VYDPTVQIAVVVPDDMVEALDQMVPSRFRSRAEAVRHALDVWLAAEHANAVDRRFKAAYERYPQGDDDVDAARIGIGRAIPQGWEELEW